MFAAVSKSMRHAGSLALAAGAALCLLALTGLALMLTLILAAPLERLRTL